MKKAQLIMVTSDNNNKFYNMEETSSDLVVHWGRVGSKANETHYPTSKWESLYRSKVKKGYVDVSEFKTELKINNVKDITDAAVKSLIDLLIQKAKNKISENYLVTFSEVTMKQCNEAQRIIDSILEYRTSKVEVDVLNQRFLELFKVIPRKMKNVKNHLMVEFDNDFIKNAIKDEQELLDNMKSQVSQNDSSDMVAEKTILEIAGIAMVEATKEEIKMIKGKLGQNEKQFVRAFRVTQEPNESDFDKLIASATNKKTELFWHGSRTENWWSILSTGLKIRPSNAVYTGSMWGLGVYFASKAQKSIGYTSLNGSYWVKGGDNNAFMCLYEVHVGNQKHYNKHTEACKKIDLNQIKKEGFDSVYAHGGYDLVNDEFIVYDSKQVRPRFIVEIAKGK